MEKTCTTIDDPETQVFKSEETGSVRLGFCVVVLFCYCCLFICLKTAYHYISFSFQTKFSDSALRGALQFSIFLRNIIDNNIFPFCTHWEVSAPSCPQRNHFAPTVPLTFTSGAWAEILQSA